MASPRGFRAVRHINGNNCFQTKTFVVDDNNPKPIYQQHLVVLSSGRVAEATSTGTDPILGVVKALYQDTTRVSGATGSVGQFLNRPLTHNLPTTGNFLPASTAGYADVYIDPDIIYEAAASGGFSDNNIGQAGTITATGSGRDSTGISLMQVDSGTFVAAASANATDPLRFVGLAQSDMPPVSTSAYTSGQLVEVMIRNHIFRTAASAT